MVKSNLSKIIRIKSKINKRFNLPHSTKCLMKNLNRIAYLILDAVKTKTILSQVDNLIAVVNKLLNKQLRVSNNIIFNNNNHNNNRNLNMILIYSVLNLIRTNLKTILSIKRIENNEKTTMKEKLFLSFLLMILL